MARKPEPIPPAPEDWFLKGKPGPAAQPRQSMGRPPSTGRHCKPRKVCEVCGSKKPLKRPCVRCQAIEFLATHAYRRPDPSDAETCAGMQLSAEVTAEVVQIQATWTERERASRVQERTNPVTAEELPESVFDLPPIADKFLSG